MKTEKNILIAFVLNLSFSVFEFLGGVFTGSVAIVSDAIHDVGDAASIGVAWFLEKKSKKDPNEKYTYGYLRYSVIGGLVTTSFLLIGSFVVLWSSVLRILSPSEVDYNGMLAFSVVGVFVNFVASAVTRDGESLNQRAVYLHMLEDVFGWIAVLVSALVIKFTGLYIVDSLVSIGISLFILVNAVKNFKGVFDVLLEKVPRNIDVVFVKNQICKIEGVVSVHHVHIWSIDGHRNCATMHVVINGKQYDLKRDIRQMLKNCGIIHSAIEFESVEELCDEESCFDDVHFPAGHNHLH